MWDGNGGSSSRPHPLSHIAYPISPFALISPPSPSGALREHDRVPLASLAVLPPGAAELVVPTHAAIKQRLAGERIGGERTEVQLVQRDRHPVVLPAVAENCRMAGEEMDARRLQGCNIVCESLDGRGVMEGQPIGERIPGTDSQAAPLPWGALQLAKDLRQL